METIRKRWTEIDKRTQMLLKFAEEASENATCHSRKLGAVVQSADKGIGIGWNGAPLGADCTDIHGTPPGKCPRKHLKAKTGEMLEICPAVHAEIRALVSCLKAGHDTKGATMYCWCGGIPCKECMKEIADAGITRLYCQTEKTDDLKLRDDSIYYNFELSAKIAEHSNIELIEVYNCD